MRRELLRSERRADRVILRAGEAADVGPAQRLLEASGLPLGGFPDDLEALFLATAERRLLGLVGLEVYGAHEA